MPNLDELEPSLLEYLGVSLFLTRTTDGEGKPLEELHIFVRGIMKPVVLAWVAKIRPTFRVVVFEGEAPPF